MKLKAGHRVTLLNTLPREGDILTLRIVRELREALSFSEEEHKVLGLKINGPMITWDASKDEGKEIQIGTKAREVIVEALNALNQQKKLNDGHLDIWGMFVERENSG
jgi:hypothetical protein